MFALHEEVRRELLELLELLTQLLELRSLEVLVGDANGIHQVEFARLVEFSLVVLVLAEQAGDL